MSCAVQDKAWQMKPGILYNLTEDRKWWVGVRDLLQSAYKIVKRAFEALSVASDQLYSHTNTVSNPVLLSDSLGTWLKYYVCFVGSYTVHMRSVNVSCKNLLQTLQCMSYPLPLWIRKQILLYCIQIEIQIAALRNTSTIQKWKLMLS